MKNTFIDWERIDYSTAWEKQTNLFDTTIAAKLKGEETTNYFIACEHNPVYTIGKSGKENNMLLSTLQLDKIGATYFHIDRGGDITYHGPGQIVVYPIIDLEQFELGVKDYIHLLEEAIIRTCASYGVKAERLEKATGVWLDTNTPRARKICAIGVRCSHYVTMHGLAFNVNTDLNYFNYINPCGFVDKGVTSLQKELGQEVSINEVKNRLQAFIKELFSI